MPPWLSLPCNASARVGSTTVGGYSNNDISSAHGLHRRGNETMIGADRHLHGSDERLALWDNRPREDRDQRPETMADRRVLTRCSLDTTRSVETRLPCRSAGWRWYVPIACSDGLSS